MRWRSLAFPFLIALVTCLAYLPAMRGDFLWDDDAHVIHRAPLFSQGLAGLPRIWTDPGATQQYYPLVHSAFWLQYQFWGLNPVGYHVVNVLLHAGAAILVWRVLRRLNVPGAALAAAVFALHPVHVESVAWISELKNTLSAVFYLGAMLAYLRFDGVEPEPPLRRDRRWYALALALFLAALMCKTVTASLPAALLLIAWWRGRRITWRDMTPLAAAATAGYLLFVAILAGFHSIGSIPGTFDPQLVRRALGAALVVAVLAGLAASLRRRIEWRLVAPLLPMFTAAVGAGLMTAWFEKHFIGAVGAKFALSPVERLLIAGRAVWFYAGKLLWPADLAFIYPRWTIDAGQFWQYLYPLAAGVVLVALWKARRRLGRGALTAVLFFGGTLFPALGFVDVWPFVYSFVADHFQYLASLGLITLLTAGGAMSLQHLSPGRRRLGTAAAGGVLVVLASLTFAQGFTYRDQETLWNEVIRLNPHGSMAYNNLAVYLCHRDGQPAFPRALPLARRAVQNNPEDARSMTTLGGILLRLDQPQEAVTHLTRAIELESRDPLPYLDLGLAMLKLHRYEDALPPLRRALDLVESHGRPAGVERTHLGLALAQLGRTAEAMAQYDAAIREEPALPDPHYRRAVLLAAQGRTDDAIAGYRQAIALFNAPIRYAARSVTDTASLRAEAHLHLGHLLFQRQDQAGAMEQYRLALAADDTLAEAHQAIADALAVAGEAGKAESHYRRALALDPALAGAQFNLGVVLVQTGREKEALAHFSNAAHAQPDWSSPRQSLHELATRSPDATVRGVAQVLLMDAQAGALAHQGQHAQALALGQQAVDLARRTGQGPLAAQLAARVEQFRAAGASSPSSRSAPGP